MPEACFILPNLTPHYVLKLSGDLVILGVNNVDISYIRRIGTNRLSYEEPSLQAAASFRGVQQADELL
ncbi:MAG: hypothetical protein OHK0046_27710 [Anaerolineae bacterium]